MRGTKRNRSLPLALALLLAAGIGALTATATSTAQATTTAVEGSAFGVSAPNVTLFGGAQTAFGPTPTVTLPTAGSATPVTSTAPSETVTYGPATFFSSGATTVSTGGTPSGGSVTSSTAFQPATQPTGTCPGGGTSCISAGQFTAQGVTSTCTASGSGNTASTTITGGQVVTATDSSGTPTTTVTIPTNPTANDSINGSFTVSASDTETFTYTFNQQTTNSDGSITVIAVHEHFLGPTAKGDLYFGQAVCGVTAATSTPPPVVTSLSSSGGPTAGGQGVNIRGSGFTGATAVDFGTAAATFTVTNDGLIAATAPPGAAGAVHVTVIANGQTSQTSTADVYTYVAAPTLSGVSPLNGPAAGGQQVTLSGANLTGASAVSFGGTPASVFTVVNAMTVTATTPGHAAGAVDLKVTTPGGTSNAVTYSFGTSTTTTLAGSPNPSIVGASVTYTATVSPVPDGGTVAFSDGGSAIAACGSQPIDASTGTATCQVPVGAVGSRSIVATFIGDFNFGASTSAAFIENVTYAITALYNQAMVTRSGATRPIKVELQSSDGTNVSAPGIVLTVIGLSPGPAPGTSPTGTFTFMADVGPGYQLNVKTKNYPATTYTLSFTVAGDPVTHTVQFIVG